jgi:hypothetical protein
VKVPDTVAVASNCSEESALPKVTAAGAGQVMTGATGAGMVGAKETPLKFESCGAVARTLKDSLAAWVAVVKLSVSVIPKRCVLSRSVRV